MISFEKSWVQPLSGTSYISHYSLLARDEIQDKFWQRQKYVLLNPGCLSEVSADRKESVKKERD